MRKRILAKSDFDLEPPRSLVEVIEHELQDTGTPISEELVGKLLERVCQRIEREALETYHSGEPWALKSWVYSHLLGDMVASESNDSVAAALIAPVTVWQDRQGFAPLKYYRQRLETERKSPRTIEAYMLTASRFVAKCGRKAKYSDDDIESYLGAMSRQYPNQNTFGQECRRLLQLLRRLPGADKGRELPIKMPRQPEDFYQPTLSDDEVETLVWACVLDNIPVNDVVRLLVSSTYGARRSELTELCSEDIYLDGDKSTIYIKTTKHGQRRKQPIPPTLVPLLSVPISKMHGHTIQRHLQQICRRAGVMLPYGGGFHCLRRRVATNACEVEVSDGKVSDFMRWKGGRSMLERYRQTDKIESDKIILERLPVVKLWEQATPYILRHNPHYQNTPSLYGNT